MSIFDVIFGADNTYETTLSYMKNKIVSSSTQTPSPIRKPQNQESMMCASPIIKKEEEPNGSTQGQRGFTNQYTLFLQLHEDARSGSLSEEEFSSIIRTQSRQK
jgi:hypothetical protein